MHTSGISRLTAQRRETMRFLLASDTGAERGIIAPVRITAFPKCSSMKDKAEAV